MALDNLALVVSGNIFLDIMIMQPNLYKNNLNSIV